MENVVEARKLHHRKLLRAHRLGEAGKFDKAEAIYRKYIARYPDDPQVLFNLGVLVQRRANSPAERVEALDFYQRCIAAPGEAFIKANAANNCGLIMGKINRIEEATIFFHLALQINPNLCAARINFGDMLRHNCDFHGANREFGEVLKLDPNSDAAKFSAGMIKLMLGDLKEGFSLYESRFGVDSFPTKKFKTNKPEWSGEDLNGKTLLVVECQGMGDTFHMCRYFRELKRKWVECRILFVGNVLYRNISKGMDGLDQFFAVEDKLPIGYDYFIHLLSLPHRFGTTIETIPNEAPYIRPGAGWEKYGLPDPLLPSPPLRKIGLCWAGSPRHGKDAFRSLAPEAFQPLIDTHPDIQFYSLQVGPRADECARLKNIIDLAPTVTDWTDTANAILQLDDLVTVDTAILHLAGALGKPAKALIPFSPDWRWQLTTETSPWYPKLRLFRQPKQNDWETPLKRINEAL